MILIRVDANEHIGSGHVMRCLSIASAFVKRGESVVFVTSDHKGDKLIKKNGFPIICLDTNWKCMKSEELDKVIRQYKPDLLLIDSYFVTENYFRHLSSMVTTAYIDDMQKSCWDTDFLINYNIFASVYDYSWYDGTRTKLLLHPQYTPLRQEFINLPHHETKDIVSDILISAGGADPERVCEKLMKDICCKRQDLRFHFVIGALNPRVNIIKGLAKSNTILHINEQNMSELMRKCDVAISAAGTTLYELCACGIPTITYILADNQVIAAERFATEEVMINAGDCHRDNQFLKTIGHCLTDIIENKQKRYDMSKKMQALVDGNGANRIVERLI